LEFKDRLTQLRKELKLTQVEFAQKMGYTRTAVSAWEVGRNEPSNTEMLKIANFFNVSTDYLLGKSDIRNNNELLFNDNKININLYSKDYINITDSQINQITEFAKLVLKDNLKPKYKKN
jgi:transcriptional regulator with XRE-family HTH domain